jgi:hypothetical protein
LLSNWTDCNYRFIGGIVPNFSKKAFTVDGLVKTISSIALKSILCSILEVIVSYKSHIVCFIFFASIKVDKTLLDKEDLGKRDLPLANLHVPNGEGGPLEFALKRSLTDKSPQAEDNGR